MIPVSAAHAAAQVAPSAEVRFRLLGILSDVAHKDFGAIATAGDVFSSDFPAAGAVDGQLHHLNYGLAATAEDGIGKSGWKSATAALTATRTTKADWNAGTQAGVKTMGDHVELAFGTASYDEDFDALTNGTIVGQAGWTQPVGAGTFAIADSSLPADMEGKALHITGDADGTIRKLFAGSVPTKQTMTFIANRTVQGGGGALGFFSIDLRDGGGAVNRFSLRWLNNLLSGGCSIVVGPPGGLVATFTRDVAVLGSTVRYSVDWDHGGDPTNALVRVWMKQGTDTALQIYEGTHNMTGVDTVDIQIDQFAAPDAEMWIDNLRFGSEFSDDGTQDNVIDHGTAPTSAAALLTFNGRDDRVFRVIPGGFYVVDNQDTLTPIRRTTSPQGRWVAQTFEVTSIAQLDAVALVIGKTGTPTGNLWVELRDTDGTQPVARVLSRSKSLVARTYSATADQKVIFEFPEPWVLQTGRRYALVVTGDWALDNGNCLTIGVDASAPGYASGQVYDSDNNSTWTSRTQDMVFVTYQFHQVEAFYDLANRDASVTLGGSSSDYLVGQGFKFPKDRSLRHFQVLIRKHEGASFAAADTLRCEIHQDDGTGKSNGTILARGIEYQATQITWGGTEAAQVFELFVLSLPTAFAFQAGVQYILVIRPTWAAHATNHLDIGVDNSSASYADGVRSLGSSAGPPVWVATSTSDLIFAILSEHRTHVEFEAAYSADNSSYSAFEKITHNPTRLPSMANIAFTGQALRYWKIRAIMRRRNTVGPARPWTPVLSDYTLKVIFGTPKVLTVALTTARTISRIEVYAHPTEAGCRVFKVEVSTNGGGAYSLLSGYSGLEARRRGGGATVSESAGTITTTGDYIAADLAADVVGATHLKLTVLGNVDEWARVLELRAFRVVDMGHRALGDPAVSTQSDFVQRRFRARQFNISLDNTDGFLSPLGNLGGFNSELGEGMRLLFETGYKDATDFVRQGEFFVDNWVEQPQTCIINVAARDLVKLADVEVQAKYKTDKRSWELIEYLMNLANIPSQWMTIDRTSSRVKHFAIPEPNAWQESQKIAEAAGFADLFIDRAGYLNFRGSGMSCGDTGIPVTGNTAGASMSYGPPVLFAGKVYNLISGTTSGTKELKLVEYTPETGVWVTIGTVDSFTFAGEPRHFGGYLFALGDALFIFAGSLSTSGTQFFDRLYSWPGTGSTFTLLAEWDTFVFDQLLVPASVVPFAQPIPAVQEDQWFYVALGISGGGPFPNSYIHLNGIDLLNFGYKPIFVPITGAASIGAPASGLAIESGRRIVSTQQSVTSSIPETKVYLFEPFGQTATLIASLNAASQGHTLGIESTGKGYVYVINHYAQLDAPSVGAAFNPTLYKIAIPSGTVTTYPELFTSTGTLSTLRDTKALAYIDGIHFAGAIQDGALRRLVILDEDTDRAVSPGSLTLASSRIVGFRSFTIGGQSWVFGVTDDTRCFEAQIRRRRPMQDTEVFTISSGPDGLLLGANIDHGTDKGGDNRIINLAIVKSEPLIDFPVEVLWSADRLPWTAPVGKQKFKVQLRDPGLTLSASITTSPVSSATVVVTDDAIQPELTITVTAACNITALSISGRPLRKAGTLVVGAVGPGKSLSRFGVRSHTIQNDYVYDTLAAAPIATWLVINFPDRKTKADGVQSLMLGNLEALDLIRLRDDRTGLNQQFYVTGFRHSYKSQRSALTVLQKAGVL